MTRPVAIVALLAIVSCGASSASPSGPEVPDDDELRAQAIETIRRGLQVPAGPVKVAAIRTVERQEIEELAPEVVQRMGDEDDAVAAAAAVAVLRSHPSAPKVAADLLTSSDPRARAIVIEGLGRKFGALARTDITRALTDSSVEVRRAAASAFDRFADAEDVPALIASLRSDADGTVRARALRALARASGEPPVDIAAAALEDEYLGTQLAAIDILERSGDMGSGHLVKAAASEQPMVAIRAAVALNAIGSGDGRETIEGALANPAWTVRASAVNALRRAVPENDARRLAGAALTDRRIDVRLAAARVLLSLGAERMARQELEKALDAPSPSARLNAAADLLRLGDPRARQLLADLASHRDPAVRGEALPFQRYLGEPSLGLVAMMSDDSPELRLQAAELVLEMVE